MAALSVLRLPLLAVSCLTLFAHAAPVYTISDDSRTGDTATNRTIVQTLRGAGTPASGGLNATQGSGWEAAVATAGFNYQQLSLSATGGAIPGGVLTVGPAIDGTCVRVSLRNMDGPALGTGPISSATQPLLSLANTMQSNSPRPSSLYAAPQTEAIWNETSIGNGTSRNALLFEFLGSTAGACNATPKAVRGYGAWFGDVESALSGLPAQVVTLTNGVEISRANVIGPSGDPPCVATPVAATNTRPQAGNCGNETTRWVGFVDSAATPTVNQMLVIVGDYATGGNGNQEHLSFIGPTIAYAMPRVTLTKTTTHGIGGSFGFTLTNTTPGSGGVSTTATNTATMVDADGAQSGDQPFIAAALGTAIQISETSAPSGWNFSTATCVDRNGTPTGSFASGQYTIAASAVIPDEVFTCNFTNEAPPNLSVNKVISSAPGANPIQYSITVTNTGGAGTYALSDTLLPGTGLVINGVSCANTTVGGAGDPTPTCGGAAPWIIADAGTAIAGSETHTYTVSIDYSISNALTSAVGSGGCPTTNPTNSIGGLNNTVTLTPNFGSASTQSVCESIAPNSPSISLAKTITSPANANPVTYLVSVTNSGGEGSYGLTDSPLFGSGISVGTPSCANISASGGGTPNCTGAAPYVLAANNTPIAGDATHTYTISIPYTTTIAATDTAGSAQCPNTAPLTSSGGLNNVATLTPASGSTQTVNACANAAAVAPTLNVTKTITSAAGANPITYALTVSNSGGAGSYTLADTPLFGSGITTGSILCTNTTAGGAGGVPNCSGSALTLASAGTAIAGGATHTYTVSIAYTITPAATASVGSTLCPTTAPTSSAGGLNNVATLSPAGGGTQVVSACADAAPIAPSLSVSKAITSAVGANPVVYEVRVTNAGGAGSYALTDTPRFGAGVTLGSATCASTGAGAATPVCTGASPFILAPVGTTIAGLAEHRYTVTIAYSVETTATDTAGSARCPSAAAHTSPGGLNNVATLDFPGASAPITQAACQDVAVPLSPPDVGITISGIPASVQAGALVTALLDVRNLGQTAATDVVATLALVPGLSGVVVSNGGTYNAATGIVTWPSAASLASGSPLAFSVRFAMPTTGFNVSASVIASNEQSGATANNVANASIVVAPPPEPTTPQAIPLLPAPLLAALALLLALFGLRSARRSGT